MISMYKIAVLGDRQSVIGFTALGLSVFPVEDPEEAKAAFHRLASREEYAIIYVTEELNSVLASDIEKYKDSVTPAIILIPDRNGSRGGGLLALQSAVERAVGSADILNI